MSGAKRWLKSELKVGPSGRVSRNWPHLAVNLIAQYSKLARAGLIVGPVEREPSQLNWIDQCSNKPELARGELRTTCDLRAVIYSSRAQVIVGLTVCGLACTSRARELFVGRQTRA